MRNNDELVIMVNVDNDTLHPTRRKTDSEKRQRRYYSQKRRKKIYKWINCKSYEKVEGTRKARASTYFVRLTLRIIDVTKDISRK